MTSEEREIKRTDGYIKAHAGKRLVLVRKAKKGVRKDLYRLRNVYKKIPITFTPQEQDQIEMDLLKSKIARHQAHQEMKAASSSPTARYDRRQKMKELMKH
jgi:hypothetical protein